MIYKQKEDTIQMHAIGLPSGNTNPQAHSRRVLLLTTATTYRTQAFMEAAARLQIDAVKAVDMPRQLAEVLRQPLGIDFSDLEAATQIILEFAAKQPLDAVIAVDESGTLLAARASAALGKPHNSPGAADAARDKYRMRTLLAKGGVPVPSYGLFSTSDDPQVVAAQVEYPCVVKPLRLSGSRGVIRADDSGQLTAAIERVAHLLTSLDSTPDPKSFLIEQFIPGFEVALEGILNHGRLQVLALFDKPDPLDGPFFEETIYVTPSRLPDRVQAAIAACAANAAKALGLREGPMHAELRINQAGPWIVEVAGRSIGGLCSKTLRFGTDASLEELILRQACGLEIASLRQEQQAGGVMMIPIPTAGLLRSVEGIAAAEGVPGIEEIQITAKLHYPIVPLPEGDSYLGFIFACGETPDVVEATLREALSKLHFRIEPAIALLPTN